MAKVLTALVVMAACTGSPDAELSTSSTSQSVWTNGDFENDAVGTTPPSGWTLAKYLNPGITDTRPSAQTLASLNLATGGTAMTYVVGGAPETQTDPDLGTNGTIRFPKYGNRAVRVNYASASSNGSNQNVNSISQQMTVGIGDVDPSDNKVHVRFALAPILENPGHSYDQQPYYFVRLQNITKNTTVYQDFNASGQSGVPWKNFTDSSGQAAQYTDWQLVDIAPGDTQLAVGDQVQLLVVASGCAAGGHWGRVYVDAVGSGVPGLYAWATGAQQANAGTDLTYTLNYKNGGTTTTTTTKLDLVTPPYTTYKSTTGASCTAPTVGATGTVSCSLGTLAPGATGSYTITVNIPSATANGTLITNGNYSIYASGVSALVGPKANTTVTSGAQYANLGITKTDGVAAVGWGTADTYTIVVSNAGPLASNATVTDTMPAQLSNVTWTCAAAGGATCTAAGSGNISDTIGVPVGGTATYTVNASIVAGSGSGSVVNTASVATSGGISDPDTTNNSAVDSDTIGTLRTLSLSKLGTAAVGTISSTPAAISCGSMCSSASADFLDGSQVNLTATPIAGATFVGWGGACSGTSTTCSVTMAGAQSVTATFAGAPATTTVLMGGSQSATISTAFAAPLTVLVADSNGTPVPGATVTYTRPSSGASATLSAATATTSASGTAQVTATANATAGSYQITGSVAGVTPVATFNLANIGVPASIAVSSGSPQSATVNTSDANLVALVRDSANQPVPGVVVTFAAPASGATAVLGATTATTNSSGLATVGATAGTIAGTYSVSATVASYSTSFVLTNTAGAAASLAIGSGDGQSATVATAFASPLVATALDAYGNPVAGISISFASTGASFAPTSATTGSSGTAQTTATAGHTAGSYAVTASASGLGSISYSLANTAGAPATIAIVSGSGQTATVHTAFASPLAVSVADVYGNPAPGATVTFAAPGAGASATVSSASTNALGIASTGAVANNLAGSYNVTASVGAASVQFGLANAAGAPATVTWTSGTGQTVTVGTSFASIGATVVDAYGNPVPGVSVTVTSPASGASALPNPLTITTNASGVATGTLTANHTAGTFSVTAAAGSATTATMSLTNHAGAAAAIAAVTGSGQHATVATPFASSLVALVSDQYGNPVQGSSVSFSAGANATFGSSPATTAVDGKATTSVTAGQLATAYTVTASITGASTTFSLTNDAGAPATIAVASGSSQSAIVGAAFGSSLVAHVTDAFNNDVPSATVTFTAPGSGATAVLSATTAQTGSTGRATITATAGHVTGSYSVSAAAGSASPTSFSLTNTAGAVATLSTTGGSGQEATVLAQFIAPLAVHAVDQYGNSVPDATIDFSAPSTGASATFADAGEETTDASGNAQIVVTAGAVSGAYAVQVTSGAGPAINIGLTNLPGAAAAVAVLDGSPQTATVTHAFGAPMRVTVRDAQGNTVPNATVRFAGATTGPSATPASTLAVTDADGIATMTATANTIAGANDLVATVASASAPFHLTNAADAPTTITASETSSPQWMTVQSAYAQPLVATVTDRYGNPTPNITVAYAVPTSAATAVLSAASSTTDTDGHASVTATASAITGAYIVHASVLGVTGSAAYTLTNTAGAPATIAIANGDAQSATVDTDFASELAVLVSDSNGNAVPDAVVTFASPTTAASAALPASAAQADANGIAHMTAHASTKTGSYQVIASLVGTTSPIAFSLTNTAGAPVAITASLASTPQAAHVDGQFQQPLTAIVTDAFGNIVPDATVTYSVPASGASGHVDSSGFATAGTVAGSYTITASVAGVTAPATFTLQNLAGDAQTLAIATGDHQSATVGAAFAAPLTVLVTDIHHNPVPGADIAFAGAATIADAATTTDANGLATTALTSSTHAGSFTIIATTPNGAAPASFALESLAGAPATTAVAAIASPQSAEVLHAYAQPLALVVKDTYGNLVPDATVAFAAPSAPGVTLSAASAQTGRDGVASVLAIADDTSGAFAVTAAVAGTTTAEFSMTNLSSSPNHVLVTDGGSQHALATAAFAAPIALRVVDAYGNPVANVPLTIASTGATASSAAPVSDTDGRAQVTLTAGPVVGDISFSAQAPGALTAGTTTLTIDAIPTTLTATAAPTPVDAPIAITITVAAQLGQATGTVTITDSDGTQLGTATLEGGTATIDTAGLARGSHTITATYAAQGSYGASSAQATSVVVTDDSGSISGGGCSTSGQHPMSLLFIAALVLGVLSRRRKAVVASVLAVAGVASADEGARSLDRYHAASADSAWFALDSASFSGKSELALSFVGDYANQPLTVFTENGTVRQRVVTDSFIIQLGGSYTLNDDIRISANVPLSPWQDGNGGTYNGMTLAHANAAFGDISLAGDYRVFGAPHDPVRLAVGARINLPTGSTDSYMSDGVFGFEPRAQLGGSYDIFEYAAGASVLLRGHNQLVGETFGSELRYQAAGGVKLADAKLLVGPELVGATPLESGTAVGTPLELQLGAHYQAMPELRVGLAGGVGLINAVGEPSWRMLLSVAWAPHRP